MSKKILLVGAGILGATLLLKKITAMPPDLVAYWKCDEGEGNILKDYSGNKNDGEIHGAEWVEGIEGKALYFNGINNYVLMLDSKFPIGSTDRTISVWINAIPYQSHPIIFEYGTYIPYQRSGFGLVRKGEDHSMRFIAHERYHNINATEIFGLGWHHLVWVIKNKKLYFYVDDVLDGVGGVDIPNIETVLSGKVTIGAGIQLDFRHPFKGTIDEIKIFDRALDLEGIEKI